MLTMPILKRSVGTAAFYGDQPRHYICTSASRGLSAIAEFLVKQAFSENSLFQTITYTDTNNRNNTGNIIENTSKTEHTLAGNVSGQVES